MVRLLINFFGLNLHALSMAIAISSLIVGFQASAIKQGNASKHLINSFKNGQLLTIVVMPSGRIEANIGEQHVPVISRKRMHRQELISFGRDEVGRTGTWFSFSKRYSYEQREDGKPVVKLNTIVLHWIFAFVCALLLGGLPFIFASSSKTLRYIYVWLTLTTSSLVNFWFGKILKHPKRQVGFEVHVK